MAQKLTVVVACGGTGGHLFPGIAVAEELKRRKHEALLLISEKQVDADASAKYGELEFVVVPAVAKPPTLSPRMIPFLVRVWKTAGRCRRLLKERKADVVLGMGGFTSLPPVYAGYRLGLRTYLHDSNAVPGKSNLLTSRFCTKALVGLEVARRLFAKCETRLTGTPVRAELRDLPDRAEALRKYGFDPAHPVVLVVGGSQGARRVNTLVLEASRALGDKVQWLHVSGTMDHERIAGEAAALEHHRVLAFCDDMPSAYAAADVVLCRAGASSLTELSLLGIPALLVPYPHAADDHQTKNAETFVGAGGAIMLPEDELTGARLAAEVEGLLGDADKLRIMAAGMRSLSVDDAAGRICDVLEGGDAP